MNQKIPRCPECNYELVLTDVGDCYAHVIKEGEENVKRKKGKCEQKYFCYECKKYL